jgi:DeoR family suf operon transcriptional repressor
LEDFMIPYARTLPGTRQRAQEEVANLPTLLLKDSSNPSSLLGMTAAAPILSGYRGTRAEVLVAVKRSQPVTVQELAEQFGVSANGLRRHLKELEADGTVSYQRVVRGVGGPVYTYSLTEVGEALFPRAYDQALTEALEVLRERIGVDGVVEVFRRRWSALAAERLPELSTLPLEERAARLAQLLSSLGYMAESDAATLTEHNCAIRAVAERFPEVCAAEAKFLEEWLGAHVERTQHIASGARCCEYCIQSRLSDATTATREITS